MFPRRKEPLATKVHDKQALRRLVMKKSYQKNTNSTWGYKAIEDNQTIYTLENNPSSSSGYSTIEESTTAGQRILKAMQLQKNLRGHLKK